jgi:hypothetical protein
MRVIVTQETKRDTTETKQDKAETKPKKSSINKKNKLAEGCVQPD